MASFSSAPFSFNFGTSGTSAAFSAPAPAPVPAVAPQGTTTNRVDSAAPFFNFFGSVSSCPAELDGLNFTVIGCGNMGSAVVNGLLKLVLPSKITISSPSGGKDIFKQKGVLCVADNKKAIENADVIIFAVKPQIISDVVKEVDNEYYLINQKRPKPKKTIYISVAAGTTLQKLSLMAWSGKWCRVMPNIPCSIGEGAIGYCFGQDKDITETDKKIVKSIFSSMGIVHEVSESQMDAITALAGSGPAFVYMMIESLADGGVAAGLSRSVAMSIATQVVKGSAMMVSETKQHPAQLKDAVASPGGTTIAGIQVLENGSFRGTVMNAVTAATTRANNIAAGYH